MCLCYAGQTLESDATGSAKTSMDCPLLPSPSMPLDLMEDRVDSLEARQSDVAYRGLSVRMMIVTGKADKVTFHSVTRRREYEGEVS